MESFPFAICVLYASSLVFSKAIGYRVKESDDPATDTSGAGSKICVINFPAICESIAGAVLTLPTSKKNTPSLPLL
jgi:hypothetical protein